MKHSMTANKMRSEAQRVEDEQEILDFLKEQAEATIRFDKAVIQLLVEPVKD